MGAEETRLPAQTGRTAAVGQWLAQLPRRREYPVLLGLFTMLVYGALAVLISEIPDFGNSPESVASFWPAAGVTVVIFLCNRVSTWPAIAAGILAAEISVDLYYEMPGQVAVFWGAANVMEPVVSATLLRLLIKPEHRRDGGSPTNLVRFVLCAVVAGPAVGAVVGATGSALSGFGGFGDAWVRWLVGDAVGVITVAPALLALGERRTITKRTRPGLVLLVGAFAVLCIGPVPGLPQSTLTYLVLPVLIWLAFMADIRSATLGVLIVGLTVNLATLLEFGPFSDELGIYSGLVNAQIFLGTLAFSTLFVAVITSDLQSSREVQALLREQARRDLLTGLGNRRLLLEDLDSVRQQAGDTGRHIGFLLIDLDNFKEVNDQLGHAAGDAVLVETASRLRAMSREGDLVVRLGGDEFLICLNRLADLAEARAIADRVLPLLAEPITFQGQTISVSASVGVAVGTADAFDPDEAMREADHSMYAMKLARAGMLAPAPDAASPEGAAGQVEVTGTEDVGS